jgi:hypothetical protein
MPKSSAPKASKGKGKGKGGSAFLTAKSRVKGSTADFRKVKAKVGKRVAVANATDTSFRSKRVCLAHQSILSEASEGSGPQSSRGKATRDLLKLMHHPAAKVIREALVDLRDIAANHPEYAGRRLVDFLGSPMECLLSPETGTRRELLQLQEVVLSTATSTSVSPFAATLVAYASAAMNSLDRGVRGDGLAFVALLLRLFPSLMVARAGALLPSYPPLMEVQTGALNQRLRESAAGSLLTLLQAMEASKQPPATEANGPNIPPLVSPESKPLLAAGARHMIVMVPSAKDSLEGGWGERMSADAEHVLSTILSPLLQRLGETWMEITGVWGSGSEPGVDQQHQPVLVLQLIVQLLQRESDTVARWLLGFLQSALCQSSNSSAAEDNVPKPTSSFCFPCGVPKVDVLLCLVAARSPIPLPPSVSSPVIQFLEAVLSEPGPLPCPALVASTVRAAIVGTRALEGSGSLVPLLVKRMSQAVDEEALNPNMASLLCDLVHHQGALQSHELPISLSRLLPNWILATISQPLSALEKPALLALRILTETCQRRPAEEVARLNIGPLVEVLVAPSCLPKLSGELRIAILSLMGYMPSAELAPCLPALAAACSGKDEPRLSDWDRGLALEVLSYRSQKLSPAGYLGFLLSVALGGDLKGASSSSSKDIKKKGRGGTKVRLPASDSTALEPSVSSRDAIVEDVCWCLERMARRIQGIAPKEATGQPPPLLQSVLPTILSVLAYGSGDESSVSALRRLKVSARLLQCLCPRGHDMPASLKEAFISAVMSAMSDPIWGGQKPQVRRTCMSKPAMQFLLLHPNLFSSLLDALEAHLGGTEQPDWSLLPCLEDFLCDVPPEFQHECGYDRWCESLHSLRGTLQGMEAASMGSSAAQCRQRIIADVDITLSQGKCPNPTM